MQCPHSGPRQAMPSPKPGSQLVLLHPYRVNGIICLSHGTLAQACHSYSPESVPPTCGQLFVHNLLLLHPPAARHARPADARPIRRLIRAAGASVRGDPRGGGGPRWRGGKAAGAAPGCHQRSRALAEQFHGLVAAGAGHAGPHPLPAGAGHRSKQGQAAPAATGR